MRQHYRLGGDPDGPPFLLQHGWAGTSYTWRRVATRLAKDSRGLVRQLGFGSGRPIVVAAHDMGAPNSLVWAGSHPEELAALLHRRTSLRPQLLRDMIVYTEDAAATGSLWWWLLALAPNAPERIIVGREREYLGWFYGRVSSSESAVADGIDEYLRTFAGVEACWARWGLPRRLTARQTELLAEHKGDVPVVGVGGSGSTRPSRRALARAVVSPR